MLIREACTIKRGRPKPGTTELIRPLSIVKGLNLKLIHWNLHVNIFANIQATHTLSLLLKEDRALTLISSSACLIKS